MKTYIRHGDWKQIVSDIRALLLLNAIHKVRLEEMHEATQRRVKFFRDLKEFAEDGKIAIVTSGMDCDGVQYSGNWTIVDATQDVVEKRIESICEWADGPIYSLELMRPSVAKGIEAVSRDRTMEAFENGHPWSI